MLHVLHIPYIYEVKDIPFFTLWRTCTSYVPTLIYIADMHTKEVSKCTVTSELSIFS